MAIKIFPLICAMPIAKRMLEGKKEFKAGPRCWGFFGCLGEKTTYHARLVDGWLDRLIGRVYKKC